MKILINTISREDVINKTEAAEKGTKEEQTFASTIPCPVIMGHTFPIGEWIHIDEKDIDEKELAKYPDIKEAHVALEERLKQRIDEDGLSSFAQGLQDAAVVYKQELPAIAGMILKIAPVKVKVEVG